MPLDPSQLTMTLCLKLQRNAYIKQSKHALVKIVALLTCFLSFTYVGRLVCHMICSVHAWQQIVYKVLLALFKTNPDRLARGQLSAHVCA